MALNIELEDLLKELRDYRADMVARNYPYQRISDIITIGINLPGDDLISVILAKNFSDRQIKVEKKHIDYIIKRIDRSYEKISQFVTTLDKYSLKKGSSFSLKLIKEVLNMV